MKIQIKSFFTTLLFIFLGMSFLDTRCTSGKIEQMPSLTMLPSRSSLSSVPSKTTIISLVTPSKSQHSTATELPTAIATRTLPPTKTITHTPTILPSLTFTTSPTPTLESTLTKQDSEKFILELIETNRGCKLPCLWGIVPGQTTFDDAKRFSYYLGWRGGDYFNGTVYETGFTYLNQHLTVKVSFFNSAGVVGSVHIGIAGENYLNLVKAYTFKQILSTYGVPTQVWINLATGLEVNTPAVTAFCTLLYYQDAAILAKYCGSAIKMGSVYQFCPTNPNYGNPDESTTQGNASLTLGIPGMIASPNDLIKPFGPFDGMLTVEEALGLSIVEFYNKAVSDKSLVCYETQRDIWP